MTVIKQFGWLCIFVLSTSTLVAQSKLLQSGPMVGYSTMKEVLLWVQTKKAAKVYFKYWEEGKPQTKMSTPAVLTKAKTGFVAKVVAEVSQGKKYAYELYINNRLVKRPYPLKFQSQTLWQYRTDPPPFKFVFGSCAYVNEPEVDRPGKSYGGDFHIFKTILDQKPDFMVWGGDNVYLREVDWNSRTGIMQRYTHTRSLPELQPLWGSVHHFATWDDHDFGPDNSDGSFWNKELTTEAFKLFWGNPNYGVAGGISGTFTWNDVQFFLMDNRYFRTSSNPQLQKPQMLGDRQLQWLVEALKYSRASFKFVVVGSQVLNNTDFSKAYWAENYSKYKVEQQKLIKAIKEANVRGVVFLTGDRHHTELSKLEQNTHYPLYDVTISPFTAGASGKRGEGEKNTLRVPNTYVGVRNFAVMEVKGPRRNRVLTMKVLDSKGKEMWKYEIKARDLRKK
ncbi:alkaline phosphatase [uncultured Microscilla sp.]|uniref:alkaline phosphatase D family protein n=1 Tax=uncultured Microscilla sp. TaxID=432653 RepID=UPI00261F895D|nr:alkaline phosphatase D family protein [uncultured Microscilla sp.]